MDGDGIFESATVTCDINGDGIPDGISMFFDTQGDGYFDTVVTPYDINGDGYAESIATAVDINGDGIPDLIMQDIDSDGDRIFDIHTESQFLDVDGNGTVDTVLFSSEAYHDLDGDGIFDAVSVFSDTDGDGLPELTYIDPSEFVTGSIPDLPNFDPDNPEIDPSDIVGDPGADMELWEFQGNTGRCNLFSQKFIIEALTGEEIDMEEFARTAEENGWFTEEGGTPALFMNKMLDYYGIENHMGIGGTMEDIEKCLEDGGKVMVAVDSGEIWTPNDVNEIYGPNNDADHVVQVIGIDRSDPEQTMDILNDSGDPDGCGEMVPLEQFTDAWEDSGCQYTFAYV